MKNLLVIITAVLMLSSCGSTTSKKAVHNHVEEWDAHLTYEGKPYVFSPGSKQMAATMDLWMEKTL
ncbi:MAG: hypothetical protein QM768_09225 [Agriterribacter sp.]